MPETTTRAQRNELKRKHAEGEEQQRQKQRRKAEKKARREERTGARRKSRRGKCKRIPHVAQKIKMLAGS